MTYSPSPATDNVSLSLTVSAVSVPTFSPDIRHNPDRLHSLLIVRLHQGPHQAGPVAGGLGGDHLDHLEAKLLRQSPHQTEGRLVLDLNPLVPGVGVIQLEAQLLQSLYGRLVFVVAQDSEAWEHIDTLL